MNCLDVMYQVFGPQPYFSSYSPYHHQKLAFYSKMENPQELSSRLGPSGPPAIKEEDKELPPGAEYLSSRCVLFTYYQGDISTVVDEHFSRALSQTSAYPTPSGNKAPRDGSFPMSQRSFPPSFWNSSYQPAVSSTLGGALSAPHADISFPADPYSSSSLHSHLHQPSPDTWHPSHHHHHHHHPYSLGGAISAQSSAYSRPGVHEMYGAAFDPRYGSLLVPSVRSHHRLSSGSSVPGPSTSPCDLGGKGESGTGSAWSGAFAGAGAEIGLNIDTALRYSGLCSSSGGSGSTCSPAELNADSVDAKQAWIQKARRETDLNGYGQRQKPLCFCDREGLHS
ncbi:LOW QUALITY PROTEIN: transcription cofactor vestigial-like protein 2 [Xiphophorus maculatus]|uniref:LOW QUALITY PROTEIN: transcription cofactor vestigial-like protein 2 n=1 Tax=Xiphophorus maculatus TaxID=8083 RepID=UPI000C6CA1F9|nr:LOW QUALITY PROTEIN: transcription cofactor vestigial-like protein 2 [Xiphophorus maculatus]